MKQNAIRRFRRCLNNDQAQFGLWVTLESPSITESAVAIGADWVLIDAEHGHLDWKEIQAHLQATTHSETVALVRIQELNGALIKRVLDMGADGIIVPWIETAEQLTEAVRWAHYPPYGKRGIGGERATGWGQCFGDHVAQAEGQVLVIPLIESVAAGQNIESLLDMPGVDQFFFGPADYSSTAGYPGQWEGPGVAESILANKDQIRARGKQCGVMSTGQENLMQRLDQGFRMLGLGTDMGMMLRSLHDDLQRVGRDQRILPSLSAASPEEEPGFRLPRPPESMRPDRLEAIILPEDTEPAKLVPGVTFKEQVGKRVNAKNLTTGIVTFEPGSELPYHKHPFDESITIISGEMTVEVEGRTYRIGPLDNITIPADAAHAAMNLSDKTTAQVHIAMATDSPTRELVDPPKRRYAMGDEVHGRVGPEHITRHRLVRKYSLGEEAWFVNYCNADLLPGAMMSGGYGRFAPGGRLPAHVHDFDESICIPEGEASCVVEGREYLLGGCGTAMVPRGRVHYFINTGDREMAMIWFYAGPYPERFIVEESNATVEGNPWR